MDSVELGKILGYCSSLILRPVSSSPWLPKKLAAVGNAAPACSTRRDKHLCLTSCLLQVGRAALGLLRVSQRLLQGAKPDAVPGVVKSLQLLLRMSTAVAWDLAKNLAGHVSLTMEPLVQQAVDGCVTED